MLTLENILLFIIILILLLNIQTIVAAVAIYFQEMQEPVVTRVTLDEIDDRVREVIRPHQAILASQGFEYRSQVSITNMMVKYDTPQYSFYYYHPIKGVHAFIDTTPFKGCLRGATISYVTFYESYHIAMSYDCFAHNIMADADKFYIFDHYYGSFEKAFDGHLVDREIAGEIATGQPLSTEGFHDYTAYISAEMIEKSIEQNIMSPTQKGYKFVASLAFIRYIDGIVKGYKRAVKAIKENDLPKTSTQQKHQTLYRSSEEHVLAQQLDEKPIASSQSSKIKIFLISAISFVLFFGIIGIPWSVLPMIVVVLLVHELGHFWTMKYFGYQDTSIFFIPFFGAAAKGEKEHTTPLEEYLVSLAGPLPGIVIAVAIGFVLLFNPELRDNGLLKDYAMMSLVLNYINLLPIFPLDGGKIVQTLLFTRYPKAQFYFFLLSLLVIVLSAVMLQSILLGFFGVVLFLSINHNYSTSKLIETMMRNPSDIPIKQRVVEILTHDKRYQDESLAKKGAIAKQAIKILNAKKPSSSLMLVGMGFYLLLITAPFMIKLMLVG